MHGAGTEDFGGNARYVLQRRLGRGGFGVVYQAFDRQQNAVVALKTLHRAGADALYRFKREFRALADISHPNLVTLYDLVSDGSHWFFTMELVRGVDFLTYVGQQAEQARARVAAAVSPSPGSAGSQATMPLSETETTATPVPHPLETAATPAVPVPCLANESRLRAAARQLAEGICELHRAGKLHRDIKPSNVLVTSEGRVVILDFGLIAEIGPEVAGPPNPAAGTPSYMAPEVHAGQPACEPADWYAVGVMLFEALTGRRPSDGTDPAEFATGIPAGLDSLCRDLLSRDPGKRPGGVEVLARLGTAPPDAVAPVTPAPFVGRERQLTLLREALDSVRRERTVVALVHGTSGIGKSALANHFLGGLRGEPGTLVLAARCFERESVPFKAFDGVVDLLNRFLRRQPASLLDEIVPRDLSALVRLFPAFREVENGLTAGVRPADIAEPAELRRRAFAALRELFRRLAGRRTLVVFIDDLQWGDEDSAALLAGLLEPPHPPRLLLIACYRSEEASVSPLLDVLRRAVAADLVQVPVEGLSPEESERLAAAVSGKTRLESARAGAIARDSAGNPLFISELVRAPETGADSTSLDQVIQARVSRLSEPARRLLEVVAVAGQPIELDVAKQAARHEGADYDVMTALRGGHLVRMRTADKRREIEPYHDRIREAVSAQLPVANLRDCHGRLAIALEASLRPDPEMLAVHFHGAGDAHRASLYAAQGADQAAEALAFERAARLYRSALELEDGEAGRRRTLQARLGDALSNAGRGADAAAAYLSAAENAAAIDQLEYRRRAAAQLLMSGHLDRGIGVLRDVLAVSGMKLAPSPWRALISLLLGRARIRLRGLGYRETGEAQVPVREIIRIDTCWSVAQGLGVVDTIRAADFQARHMLLALRAGEPYRVSRALAVEAGYHALAGGRRREHTQRLLRANRELADRIQHRHPHAIGLAMMVEGMAAFLEGRWRDALNLHAQAEVVLRERCRGVAWELATSRLMWSVSLFFLGELAVLGDRLPALLKEADARGDLYEATDLRIRISHANWLAADEPETARREVAEAIAHWPRGEFYVQHWWSLIANVEILLYAGQGSAAWDLLEREWPRLRRSLLMRVQYIRIESLYHRAAAALALSGSVEPGRRKDLLRIAEADGRSIGRERMPWSDPLARLIEAGVAAAAGDPARAAGLLPDAEAGFDAAGMGLYAAAARRRRGALVGGEEGRRLLESGGEWMARQNVRNPERMTDMLAPWGAAFPVG